MAIGAIDSSCPLGSLEGGVWERLLGLFEGVSILTLLLFRLCGDFCTFSRFFSMTDNCRNKEGKYGYNHTLYKNQNNLHGMYKLIHRLNGQILLYQSE